ncbi:MAG: putative transcriptional regulator, PvuIIC [Acidimicrobiales bacterium]|nr:putative transcriptional regulator, PvuIIC [Acidimicrobiales bacterium]
MVGCLALLTPGVNGLAATVGRNMRRMRLEAGMSQDQWAAHLGYHRTFIGSVERGRRNLTLRSVEQLADRLGVPPGDLIADPGREEAPPTRR